MIFPGGTEVLSVSAASGPEQIGGKTKPGASPGPPARAGSVKRAAHVHTISSSSLTTTTSLRGSGGHVGSTLGPAAMFPPQSASCIISTSTELSGCAKSFGLYPPLVSVLVRFNLSCRTSPEGKKEPTPMPRRTLLHDKVNEKDRGGRSLHRSIYTTSSPASSLQAEPLVLLLPHTCSPSTLQCI
ncbi:unnamed protein product [Pleuronectes platessa]|uniref:Uncharacterized protein n=1 Tax=Pleuronectes platessa TaxID=8262 RepID=A0A9N7YSF9_PLEPL|nr:unnamed protein product [Pleuronectes platessa]